MLTAEDVAAAKGIADAQRTAVQITARDLDVHLNTHTGQVEVRAQLIVRNGGTVPLQVLPLRVSATLRWESVRLAGQPTVTAVQHRIADDLDHTGLANETAVPLPSPLAPGDLVTLDVFYGGALLQSAQRLTNLGAPAGRAALTDWDDVSDTFTGLRGIGSVPWYPVAGAPAFLRDGNAVPAAVEQSRAEEAGSRFHLRLTAEYSGSHPDAAFFCGERQPLRPLDAGAKATDDGGFVTAEWTRTTLGPHTPSLFITSGAPQEMAGGLLRVATDHADAAGALGEAAARLRPMLQEWLGATPRQPLDALDLPVPGAAAFSDGTLLVAPLRTAPAASLASSLVQPLSAAWLPANTPAAWLREGIPAFLQAVWVERSLGRAAALAGLQSGLETLTAQAAPESASSSSQASAPLAMAGPPLAACTAPACARVRAAYVFEMLRTLLGDASLQQALSGWAVQEAQQPGRTATAETAAMEGLLQQVAGKRDLRWFFANWIDADRGLPELQIVTVAPRRMERSAHTEYVPPPRKPVAGPIGAEPVAPTDPRDMGQRDADAYAAAHSNDAPAGSWLVAVEVQNKGGADAEVPVTVRAGSLSNTLSLHVPAHNRATIRIPFEAEPEEVQVNDGSVPEATPVQHRRALRGLTR